nr:MAG TPA: hypothetical protein [Caudoviricetes sp.]
MSWIFVCPFISSAHYIPNVANVENVFEVDNIIRVTGKGCPK